MASGKHTPTRIISDIEETVQGTPMYKRPTVEGDNITVSKKRKSIGIISGEEENASHRPEYVTENVPRKNRQSKNSAGELPTQDTEQEEDLVIDEMQVHKTMWAI